MTGGILLGAVGVWVLTQVLGGQALARLGISGQAPPTGPAPGTPNVLQVPGVGPLIGGAARSGVSGAVGGTVPGPGQPMPGTGGGG